MQTQTEELKKQEKERNFFCIVRDAFRVFARHSAIALESLGFCWSRARNSSLDSHRTNGSFFRYWQLVINAATTIVTFLMVFLIQNTQNSDAKAVHLKLADPRL